MNHSLAFGGQGDAPVDPLPARLSNPGAPLLTPDCPDSHRQAAAMALPPLAATDLQDHLMVASNDLERLQRLLADACDTLMQHHHGADQAVKRLAAQITAPAQGQPNSDEARAALQHLACAITALQFQDLASQLVDHTHRRLRSCADRLAYDTMGEDEDGAALICAAPDRPNPVTQDEMDAGSIELF